MMIHDQSKKLEMHVEANCFSEAFLIYHFHKFVDLVFDHSYLFLGKLIFHIF